MKFRFLFIFFSFGFILSVNYCYPQSQQENLEKYWRYRQRLRDHFMVVSPNVESEGVNYPALQIELNNPGNMAKKKQIIWEDANANLSHYLSILATELWLLKNNGQDYSSTLKELYYAMLTIERLDLYSEYHRRVKETGSGSVYETDRNGFIIRDDVSDKFWKANYSHFGFLTSNIENINSVYEGDDRKGMSQDNVYHTLEGLALVAKLVRTESIANIPANFSSTSIPNNLASKGIKNGNNINFELWAKDIAARMVSYMKNSQPIYFFHKDGDDFSCIVKKTKRWTIALPVYGLMTYALSNTTCSFKSNWYIKYPTTGKLVEEGSGDEFDTHFFFSYGVACAANKITGSDFQGYDSDDEFHKLIFGIILDEHIDEAATYITAYITRSMEATIITHLLLKDYNHDDYKIRSLATTGDINGTSTFYKTRDKRDYYTYEHFPLMYLALHGDTHTDINQIGSSQYNEDMQWYINLLNQAPCDGPRSYSTNNNNYSRNWSSPTRCVWPERNGQRPDMFYEFAGMDYMLLHNLFYIAFCKKDFTTISITTPYTNLTKTVDAGTIIASNTITGGNIKYSASRSIILSNSFKITGNGTFKAEIVALPGYSGKQYTLKNATPCGNIVK